MTKITYRHNHVLLQKVFAFNTELVRVNLKYVRKIQQRANFFEFIFMLPLNIRQITDYAACSKKYLL
jgi:hypothetical protein